MIIRIASKEKVASFDVDSQNCFTPLCPDELPVPEGDQIVSELNAQAQKASFRLGSKDAHSPDAIWVANDQKPAFSKIKSEHADIVWPLHAVPGTKGFELIKGLPHPSRYNFFVWKGVELDMHPYGACYHDIAETVSTGVIEFLHTHNIKTVIVGGLATEYCVKATVMQLLRAQFKVILNKGAVRGIDPQMIEKTYQDILKAGGNIVDSAAEIMNEH